MLYTQKRKATKTIQFDDQHFFKVIEIRSQISFAIILVLIVIRQYGV